jgi:integrase
MLDLYEKNGPGKTLRSWPAARKRIEKLLQVLLPLPASSVTARDLQMIVDAYPAAASAAFVVRSIRPALKWAAAEARGYLSPNVVRVAAPIRGKRRQRVLFRDELAAVLPVLRRSDRPYAAAMRVMLLTLARREEVAGARWRDVDLNAATWTLTATKNDQPHVVPLSRQAVDLLHEIGPTHPDRRIFATSTGAILSNWDRETKALQAASGTAGWHRHDLRRTGATMLGDMGELPDIIEAALNHVSIRSPLAATYNRSRYRPQVAAALQRLADALDGIEFGAGVVVPLRR